MAFAALPGAALAGGMRVGGDAVAHALAAAGGAEILARVRALRWSGTAHVANGDPRGTTALSVETRVEPFVRARTDSWIAAAGRSTARTLMIERDTGFSVAGTAQRPLSAAMALSEREQFGVYGYLLLHGARLSVAGPHRLTAQRADYPPIALALAADGRIVGAEYAIASPDDDPTARPIRENWTFAGLVSDKGVRWPRSIRIARDGRPFVQLTIKDFAVELA